MSNNIHNNIVLTSDINSKVINIIKNAKKYCYIISPDIILWPLLEREFEKNINSDKKIIVFSKNTSDQKQISIFEKLSTQYKIEVLLVDNLHFSLFFNEKESLFSSMSLYENSHDNMFELGSYSQRPDLSSGLKLKVVEDELLKFSRPFVKKDSMAEDSIANEIRQLSDSEKTEIDTSDMNYDNSADEDDSPVEMPW